MILKDAQRKWPHKTGAVSMTNSSTTTLNDDHYCSVATMADISGHYVERTGGGKSNYWQVLGAPWSENTFKSDENSTLVCHLSPL